jgi:hypothetical protein
MVVQKTLQRHVSTLAHGSLEVHETVLACGSGCRLPDGSVLSRRSDEIAAHVPPAGTFGYDVIVYVGLQRFLYHRQREEIRQTLQDKYGIVASTGSISAMVRRFLLYLEALHVARTPALAQALAADGGWPLHVDATCEDGRGTLLLLLAGWRRWALAAFKIPTERADQILPCLHEVADRFGDPCAVVRDLGRAMCPAVATFLEQRHLTIPVLSCHFHFLQDIGKDLLDARYGTLREMLRRSGVRAKLRTLARKLGRELGKSIEKARSAVERWNSQPGSGHHLPEDPVSAQAVVRSLAQWVLDFKVEGRCGRFPFDRPLVALYDRCVTVARSTDAFLRTPPEAGKARRALESLSRTLSVVAANETMTGIVASLRMRATLFDELRATLRLRPSTPTAGAPATTPEELHDIQQQLETWEEHLREQRPARGPAEDRREAIDIILDHLDRHRHSLFGHVIQLPASAGGGVRIVDRTNNGEETSFRDIKHGERRRSGRKILTQDFEALPPAAALVPNLLRQDYVDLLCGTLEDLTAAFAALDSAKPVTARVHLTGPSVESASLPAADRPIVRSQNLGQRIFAAARSRAPRWVG